MFWSKIWFFLVTALAVVAIGVAVLVPRPAARTVLDAEDVRLSRARRDVELLLSLDARNRVDVALGYARHGIHNELRKVREDRANIDKIAQALHESARSTLATLLAGTKGDDKPEFLLALDAWGRAVARAGVDEKDWGDDLSSFDLVRDALRGLMRDDLWVLGGRLYRVAAAPVITRADAADPYVGAIVVGQEVDEALARALSERVSSRGCPGAEGEAAPGCDTQVAVLVGDRLIANTGPTTVATDIKAQLAARAQEAGSSDAKGLLPLFTVEGKRVSWRVAARHLPGEAGAQGGFYAVYAERPRATGFMGTLRSVVKDDLGFGAFPWIRLVLALVVALGVGLLLMWMEVDRPLRALTHDALALGKGELKNLREDQDRGKFGSIARSVNLALDKLARDKEARADLGELYGEPPPSASKPLPRTAPTGPAPSLFEPPPPAELAFDTGPKAGFDLDIPPPPPPSSLVASTPPPPAAPRVVRAVGAPPPPPGHIPSGPPRAPSSSRQPLGGIDAAPAIARSELTGPVVSAAPPEGTAAPDTAAFLARVGTPEGEDAYFHEVFEEFAALKRRCGEPTDNLTYEKVAAKLRQNRDQLRGRYACKAVRFQVYVKDGKAAIKATPVRG